MKVSSGCKHLLPDNCKEVECLFLSKNRPKWNKCAAITIQHVCDTSPIRTILCDQDMDICESLLVVSNAILTAISACCVFEIPVLET